MALVEASQFTAYGQVRIDGSAQGNDLTVKAKAFGTRLQFTGDDKKLVVIKRPPDPIGPVSAFPSLSVKPVQSNQQRLSDVVDGAPAFKLEAGRNAVFKKGDELFERTGPIPEEVKLFVPPQDPVKFNYRVRKLGADGSDKIGTFSSPAASFAALAESITQIKKRGESGRLRRSMEGQIGKSTANAPTPARFELQIDFKRGEPVRAKIKAKSKKSKKKSKS